MYKAHSPVKTKGMGLTFSEKKSGKSVLAVQNLCFSPVPMPPDKIYTLSYASRSGSYNVSEIQPS
jgi:hypothetical protein